MKIVDDRLSLFITLGQLAAKDLSDNPNLAAHESLFISKTYDLAVALPDLTRKAIDSAEVYKLFYVFENFLRDLALEVLSSSDKSNWWSKIPEDVQKEVAEREKIEEMKAWMGFTTRGKLSLTTYPELLKIIDHCWKEHFEPLIRDKSLIQEARHIVHIRNAMGHTAVIPAEEVNRVRQVMRDWFRIVSP